MREIYEEKRSTGQRRSAGDRRFVGLGYAGEGWGGGIVVGVLWEEGGFVLCTESPN